jgi:leader peptidase (prepilin peptidase)/N-methyltransferase
MTTQLFRLAPAGTTITHALAAAAALVPAAAAASADWRSHRVPDVLVALALVPSLVAVVLAGDRAHLLASVAAGAALMALPLLLIHLVAPAAMGFGDVKIAAALGAGLGVFAPTLAVPALLAASGLTLLAAAWQRRPALPFAPGLVTGVVAALALGALEGWRAAT